MIGKKKNHSIAQLSNIEPNTQAERKANGAWHSTEVAHALADWPRLLIHASPSAAHSSAACLPSTGVHGGL